MRTLNGIVAARGLPATIKTDNGSEFIGKVMDRSAYERNVEMDFSRPGKPTDNAKVESFNGRLRQECLDADSSLQWATPAAFARQCRLRLATTIPAEPEDSVAGRS